VPETFVTRTFRGGWWRGDFVHDRPSYQATP
jgi:hypothetical protein